MTVSKIVRRPGQSSKHKWRHAYRSDAGHLAHPDSRLTRGAPGAPALGDSRVFSPLPEPGSPDGKKLTSHDFFHFDTFERAECVVEALYLAPDYVEQYLIEETGQAW